MKMCWHCEGYEHSRNCGPRCEDHSYELDEGLTDDEDTFYRCTRCGCVKFEETA